MKYPIRLTISSLLLTACATAPAPEPAAPLLPPSALALGPLETEVATLAPAKSPDEASGVLATIPFKLHDNRMVVSVSLNGRGPFTMIFDTGAPNTLTPETMKALELKSQGPDMSLSASARRAAKNTVRVREVELGGYKLPDQKFAVTNLKAIRKAFHFARLDGVLGFEFLQAARVRVNFDHKRIEFLNEGAPELEAARKMKFDFFGDKPVVAGTINGRKARIVIDTGDRSNLTLFRKFAHRSKLDKIFIHRDEITTGMGNAGPIPGKLASVQTVDLGGHEVKDVLARLPMTRHGYFYSPKVSASAGLGMLKGFNFEIDMKNQTVALQARKDYHEESTFVPVRRIR